MNSEARIFVEPTDARGEAEGVMACKLCASRNRREFPTEMNVHFQGVGNLDNGGILLFPKLSVCLDCGFSCFSLSQTELAMMPTGRR